MPNTNNKDPNVGKSQPGRIRDRRIQIVRVLLEGSFQRKLGLREMGQEVNLSPWRLAHLFKSETGMSPQRYLTLVRLQRAKYQLENTFVSVQEIGAAVGIPNPSHFTRSFKAAYGMTPVEYRKLNLRIDPFKLEKESLVAPEGEPQVSPGSYAAKNQAQEAGASPNYERKFARNV